MPASFAMNWRLFLHSINNSMETKQVDSITSYFKVDYQSKTLII